MGSHKILAKLSPSKLLLPIRVKEGLCYEIKNFILTVKTERVRLTKNAYHINLNNSSIILKINPFSSPNFYCFRNFDDVYRGLAHPKFSIDIYGAIVGVGFVEEFMTDSIHKNNGFIDHKTRFFAVNMD
ncbi:hypothetical protein N665_0446s0011 [Sinapis alba]|nr:hypothetical protein N665_0446s0011 [Sinapis alba]